MDLREGDVDVVGNAGISVLEFVIMACDVRNSRRTGPSEKIRLNSWWSGVKTLEVSVTAPRSIS